MPAWVQAALKEGGLFAVAIICLAITVATVRIFLWLYKRILDRNDVLVDRAHNKSESDMSIVAGLSKAVDKQADAIDAVADQVGSLASQMQRVVDALNDERRKTGTDES